MTVDDNFITSLQNKVDYDIFLSYSRKDRDFVQQLHAALEQACRKVWVDWQDIPALAQWRHEIYAGIEAANHFVFILSPNAIDSTVCSEELAHAIKTGKRLVPIVRQEVDSQAVHPELAKLNWIFFRESDDFEQAFQKLIQALDTDLNHVRTHTRLLVRALEWENKNYDPSFLLRGSDLSDAEQWLTQKGNQNPYPTDLHKKYIQTSRQVETERIEIELKLHRLTPEQYRNRQALLSKVKSFWVKGVLEKSLHGRVTLELGLEERLDTIEHCWGMVWETPDRLRQTLPPGTKVIDLFNEVGEGGKLLILGEPGSGKTTTLLQLVRDSLHCAEQDISQPIPVVFNLSSWTNEKQAIADWLVQELNAKYQVSKQIGQAWIEQQQLSLILDGLDEVNVGRRQSCVQAINRFIQAYGQTRLVVASRIRDYESLSSRLQFQGAVCLQPLTLEQIYEYLSCGDAELAALTAALQADTTLQELAQSPLMLNIMMLAYQGMSASDFPQLNDIEQRRKHLFDAYIQRMLNRNSTANFYSQKQFISWLSYLAKKLKQHSQTVFLIERIQPSWLGSFWQKSLYVISLLSSFFLIGGWVGNQILPKSQLVLALIFGCFLFCLIFGINRLQPVETLKWSWKKASHHLTIGIFFCSLLLVPFKIIYQSFLKYLHRGEIIWVLPTHESLLRGLVFGLSLGIVYGVVQGFKGESVQKNTYPNQGILQSSMNSVLFAIIGFLVLGLSATLLQWYPNVWVIIGLCFGLVAGGGEACIKHLILRIILCLSGSIPWNYARFLDEASRKIFLQKVGGGYIFIHRLLLEHFAAMKLDKSLS